MRRFVRHDLWTLAALALVMACARQATHGGSRPAVPVEVARAVDELTSVDPGVRRQAVEKLGELGPDAGAAAPELIPLLIDDHAEVRMAATTALGDIGPPAIPALREALGDSDHVVRRGAAYSLGQMGSQAGSAVPALLETLRDEDDGRARSYIVWALGEIGVDASLAGPHLEKALEDPFPTVRRMALQAQVKVGVAPEKAVARLSTALDDPHPEVRRAAVEALRDDYPAAAEPAVPHLVELLDDPERSAASPRGLLARSSPKPRYRVWWIIWAIRAIAARSRWAALPPMRCGRSVPPRFRP